MESSSPIIDASPQDVSRFREDGFLSLPQITSEEELAWLRVVYDELFAARTGEGQGLYFDLAGPRGHSGREALPQILGPEGSVPALRETLYLWNATHVAAALLGVDEGEITAGGHMILKPADYGRETPWHQDEAYWPPENGLPRSVSAWMPLEDASVQSGCLQFIPGSHHGEVLPHRHIDGDPTVHGLVTDRVDPARAVACPLPAGGATFHHCRTLHYAGPNSTLRARRAYILVLSALPLPVSDPQPRPWLAEEAEALARRPG